MKVWLIAENWPPRRGGIENYLSHIAQQLTSLGHEVRVFEPHTHRFFWPLVRPKWLPLFVSLWRQTKTDAPDVIICGKGLFEGLVAYYLWRHSGIPYVVCTYAMEIATWEVSRNTRRKLQRVVGGARAITYINDETRGKLVSLGATEQQLVKLLPALDARWLNAIAPPRAEATAQQFGITSPYIISVGRLVPRKGFDTLIEAFATLDQTKYAKLKLVIVGTGPDKERLERIVADNYMQTSVVWLGDVPDKYLPALMGGALLFALTPRDINGDMEGFGIVYLEAAAVGLATVGTTCGGVPEAVVHNQTGLLVESNNAAKTAAALVQLLEDKQLRERLGQQGRVRVADNFLWDKRGPLLNRLIKPVT